MSRYMFGKTECPPHGDMRSPKDRGSVSQFEGNRYVGAGSRNDPGVFGFMKPSTKMISTTTIKVR